MDILLNISTIGLVGLILVNPIVYFYITKKYDRLYSKNYTLSPMKIPLFKQLTKGAVYTVCILFSPCNTSSPAISELQKIIDFPRIRTVGERVVSLIHLILVIMFASGLVALPFVEKG